MKKENLKNQFVILSQSKLTVAKELIAKELQAHLENIEKNKGDFLVNWLYQEGLMVDVDRYFIDDLLRLDRERLAEALAQLIFKKNILEAPLLQVLNRLVKDQMALIWLSTLMPGQKAKIKGLYGHIARKSRLVRLLRARFPFLFSIATKIYYRFK